MKKSMDTKKVYKKHEIYREGYKNAMAGSVFRANNASSYAINAMPQALKSAYAEYLELPFIEKSGVENGP